MMFYTPYRKAASTTEYPELVGGHNYCRNPSVFQNSDIDEEPWCFSKQNPDFPEPCGIPKCDNLKVYVLYLIIPAVVAVALLSLCIGNVKQSNFEISH